MDEQSRITRLMHLVDHIHEHPEYLEQIKYILDNHPEQLDKKDTDGWTALMYARNSMNRTKSLDIVKLLLNYNPDLYTEDNVNRTVLYIFIIQPSNNLIKQAIKLLLDHGLDINRPDSKGQHILVDMIYYDDYDMIEYIFENTNINFYYKDNNNKSLYDIIIENDNPIIIGLMKKYFDDSLDVKSAIDL